MKKNMGMIDRVVRIILALTVGLLWYLNAISGTAAIVLLVISGVMVLTSLMGVCPLYFPFKIKTNGKTSDHDNTSRG